MILKNALKRPKIFYGYIIVTASIFILVMVHGANASYGVFLPSLQTDFGWERATISGARSLAFFLMGVFSGFGGLLTDKYGPKLTMLLSGIILGIACVLVSRVTSLWQLYLFYGVFLGMGSSGGDVVTLSTTARWFTKRRGLMSGVVKAGTGIGIMAVPLLVSWLINNYDWRTAYIVLAILFAVVIVVSAQFLKRDPSEIGLRPYGQVDNNTNGLADSTVGLSFSQTRRTWQFWAVSTVYFLIWYITESVIVHMPPHAMDIGFSMTSAAGVVSVIGGVSIAGRLVMGGISDRITNRRSLVVSLGVVFVSLVLIQFARAPWMLYLFALIYGFAHGGFFAIYSPLMAEMFGIKHHGANLGMLMVIGQTGGALGPIITGRIFDVTQSYQLAFIILVVVSAVALAIALMLKPVKGAMLQKE